MTANSPPARRAARVCGVLLLFAALAPGGAVAEEWFDAYAKGVRALKAQQAARAIEHLERAIKKRPEPGENVITYGTNRIPRYTPYLFLAEAHLMAGEPDKAREAIERSSAMAREPEAERSRLQALIQAAIERRRAAAAAPTPVPATALPPATMATAPRTTTAPSAPPETAPPTTVPVLPAAAAAPEPTGRRTQEHRSLIVTATPTPESVAPPPLETAALELESNPAEAFVYLDDEFIGRTDPLGGRLVRRGVPTGPHVLRIGMAGHQEQTLRVDVGAEKPNRVNVRLEPTPVAEAPARGLGALLLLLVLVVAAGVWWRRRARTVAPSAGPRAASSGAQGTDPTRTRMAATPRLPRTAAGSSEALLPTQDFAGVVVDGMSEQFGPFTLLDQLGRGGMAAVYLAERGGERCALKRPLAAFVSEPEFVERFQREAEIGRTLHHPNIIRIFERGQVGATPYFTMELVDGETLQDRARRDGAFAAREAARLVSQVAEALDYAHLKGIVHRDLKPSNIMLMKDGTVKVMDYGIARSRRFEGLTVTGAFLGTPDYVAPETAEGRGTDARSDLYSLGIVFYELLTGQRPFVGETAFATLQKHCTEPPTPPSAITPGCPRELEAIILKLLRKNPADRHPGAEELLIELRDYLNRPG